jgi:hypothetical protein
MPAKILSYNDVENQVSKSVFHSKTVLLLRICILGFSLFFVRHFEEFGKKFSDILVRSRFDACQFGLNPID